MNVQAMALTGTKFAPSYFIGLTWLEVKNLFAKQVMDNMDCPGQRNQAAQVLHGWKHIKESAMSGQSTLQVVTYEGPAKRFFPTYVLVDGFHRIHYWMSLEDGKVLDACPFTKLNLEVHTVIAETQEEAKLKTDEIARSFNSMASVKKNGDFLTAAVRQAGMKAASSGYQTGRGSGVVSFLKRVVDSPDTPTPVLTDIASRSLNAHAAMDQVLLVIESSYKLRAVRGRMFNPGVMEALFNRFVRLNDAELEVAVSQVVNALNALAKPSVRSVVPLSPTTSALVDTFTLLTDIDFVAKVRAAGNREDQYDYLCNFLKDKFDMVGTEPAATAVRVV